MTSKPRASAIKRQGTQAALRARMSGVRFLTRILLISCSVVLSELSRAAEVRADGPEATLLERALAPALADHRGLSGVYPLEQGVDAFAARVALVRMAERSLDAQYYIWRADDSGKLLANELIAAADRGVHIRLLLDDIGTAAADANLLALDSHTNIEIRLFNPLSNRTFRRLGALLEFGRVNRRMHNKSFTVDNDATIIGGRNIGDEYFGAGSGVEFIDFDVVGIGPIVSATKSAFDLYWNSGASAPITSVSRKRVSPERVKQRRSALVEHVRRMQNSAYIRTVHDSQFMSKLRDGRVDWYWGGARLVYDLPDKVSSSPKDRATHLFPQMRPIADEIRSELLIVSPYFVPGKAGVAFFEALRKRGVRVVIITNSLQATDVPAVHSGYQRYRKALLRAGITLYEVRAAPKPKEPKTASHSSVSGSAGTSLHAKTFIFDEGMVFVGSLNFDPRSVFLNTEMGAVVEIPALAARVTEVINRSLAQKTYRLELVPSRCLWKREKINWVAEEDGHLTRYTREPGAGLGRRMLVCLLSVLPIESQL